MFWVCVWAHRVWMARSEVKVPLASVWILLSYKESSERFCRSWKVLARRQWILFAFKRLETHEEERDADKTVSTFHQINCYNLHLLSTSQPLWKNNHEKKLLDISMDSPMKSKWRKFCKNQMIWALLSSLILWLYTLAQQLSNEISHTHSSWRA